MRIHLLITIKQWHNGHLTNLHPPPWARRTEVTKWLGLWSELSSFVPSFSEKIKMQIRTYFLKCLSWPVAFGQNWYHTTVILQNTENKCKMGISVWQNVPKAMVVPDVWLLSFFFSFCITYLFLLGQVWQGFSINCEKNKWLFKNYFVNRLDFLEQFRVYKEIEQIVQRGLIQLICAVRFPLLINILHYCGTFVRTDEPIVIHYY